MNETFYDSNCDFPIRLEEPRHCELCGKLLSDEERNICDKCNDELLGRNQEKLIF